MNYKTLAGMVISVAISTACTTSSPNLNSSEGGSSSPAPDSASRAEMPQAAAPQERDCLLVEEGFGPPGQVAVRAEAVVSGLEVPWGYTLGYFLNMTGKAKNAFPVCFWGFVVFWDCC